MASNGRYNDGTGLSNMNGDWIFDSDIGKFQSDVSGKEKILFYKSVLK